MNFWCSADGVPWSWAWRPYAGSWGLGLLFVLGYSVAMRAVVRGDANALSERERRRSFAFFGAGLVTFWVASDWPVATLGAGYLLSLHQLQYVLYVMIAPPLLWLGVPPSLIRRVTERPTLGAVARVISRPVVAIIVCNAIVLITHFPGVVDGFRPTQLGSFVLDMSWFAAGMILWFPIVRPVPKLNGLSYPGRFGYLIAATLVPSVPSIFFFFARYPIYELYELAPPVGGTWRAIDDQFVAGAIMKFGSFAVILVALSVLFYRWYRDDVSARRLDVPEPAWE